MRISYTARARLALASLHPEARDQRVRCLVQRHGLGRSSIVQVDGYGLGLIILTPKGVIKATKWLQLSTRRTRG